jgi:hypothetical protein
MKSTLGGKTVSVATAVLLSLGVGSKAASTPYFDTFSVPPYANNTTIVGQQGWQVHGAGTASLAVITNDFSGSGRGTSLFVGNASGSWGDVKQTFTGITNDHWKIQFDIYGNLPSSTFAMPGVVFYDDLGGGVIKEVASVEALRAPGAGTNAFRFNGSNSLIVPGIATSGSTWYTWTLNFHMAARTFDAMVTDGVSTGTLNNVSFYVAGANEIDLMRIFPFIAGAYPNESGLIDNISVIPESSTVLLALGGLLAVARRARRR